MLTMMNTLFFLAEESVSTADSSTSECEDAGQQNEGSSDVSVDGQLIW